MACETRRQEDQTIAARAAEVKAALERVKRHLAAGQVKIVIGPNGALALKGWKDRSDLTDACTIRALTAQKSWELRKAIATAEAMSGTKANVQATVSGGTHSHDGGRTWDKH